VKRPRYNVTVSRDGHFWLMQVDELPGVLTSVSSFGRVTEWVRDAIAVHTDTSPDSFDVTIRLDDEAREYLRGHPLT
jgi:hypothetical protein